MEYNLSQSEQTEFLTAKNANLPVVVVIHKRINVKCPVSGNIAKDSMAEWTPVKRVDISKDFLQQFPKKKKIGCWILFSIYQRYQRALSVFLDDVFILDKLKIDDKKCKTPKTQKRGKKNIENIDKVRNFFIWMYPL